MRLRVFFGLTPRGGGFPFDELPVIADLREGATAELARDLSGGSIDLAVEVPVDSSRLRLERATGVRSEGGEEIPMVEVLELGVAGVVARDAGDAAAFISRTPLSLFGKSDEPELMSEGEDDEQLLQRLGTRSVLRRFESRSSVASRLPLVAQNITALSERRSGIRLYADALQMGTDSGRLRELWRVLEAAFAQQGEDLVRLVAACPAAQDLEFTQAELSTLRALRGRASHAGSRDGAEEVARVEQAAAEAVPRVQGLAEALIVRKSEWGTASVEVERSSPRYPYVRRNGTVVIFRQQDSKP